MENKINKNPKKALILTALLIICFLIIGVSYAVWSLTLTQTDKNVVTTGCFKVEFTDQNPVTLDKAYPISDEEGKSLAPYEFTLTNTCDSEATYYINLETITRATKKLNEKYIKASLKKGEHEVFLNTLNSSYINLDKILAEASNAYKLYTGKLKAKEVTTFYLNIWLDEATTTSDEVMNATHEGKVTVSTSYKAPNEMENMMVPMDGSISIGTYTGKYINRTYNQNGRYALNKVVYESQMNPYLNAEEVVDFSLAQDRSVLGYYVNEASNNNYTLYIQADGKIKVNPIASYYGTVYNECGLSCKEKRPVEGIENWDTNFVTDMNSMFLASGNEILDLSSFDTQNVTNMSEMFSRSNFLTSLDLSSFDTSNVTNMGGMFYRMSNLTHLNISSFDTSNVNDYGGGFHYYDDEDDLYGGMFNNTPQLENIVYGDNFVHKENAVTDGMYTNCPANKPTHESWNGVSFE